MHIKGEFGKQGRFSNGRRPRNVSAGVSADGLVDPADEVRQLRNGVEYLRQEGHLPVSEMCSISCVSRSG